jgi:hypothetical protein
MTDSLITTPELRALYRKVATILLPHHQAKVKKLYPSDEQSPPALFAHYTSAEAALNILKTKRLWMRNTQCMVDYREVQYGHDLFFHAFNRDNGKLRTEFIAAIDDCSPAAATAAIDRFDKSWGLIQPATFVSCLSEHDKSENQHGRLSMWRSFAPTTARVAIVVAIPFFAGVTEKLRLIFSSVGYLDHDDVIDEMRQIIQNIRENTEFLKTEVPPAILYGFIYTMLLAGVTCLKHPGFHEEKEWRGIYCPLVLPDPTNTMKSDLKVIGGVPQKVYELPLCGDVSSDLADVDLAKIIDRVILGPSQYGYPMYEAFVDALTALGVPDARDRVAVSGIPIRT